MNKTVISDTSCLIALSKIGRLNLLNELYQEVIITDDVHREFGGAIPKWITITEVRNKQQQSELEKRLDRGEASAIALALEHEQVTLIIDEVKGRGVARSLNIEIIGTVGIIVLAERTGLIEDVVGTILQLVNKGFRLSDELINKIIQSYGKK